MNPTRLNAFLARLAISQSKASRFNSLITIGTRVVLKNLANQKTFTLKIVSAEKARPQKGEISCLSIIGAELLGQQQGAIFTIDTPNGQELWQVLKVGD
ncbi:GreA/GreB family elongation factor [Thalassotalea sp. 1_MG-2023]|uniref:GreA/GreB family elongation factor n=1 Tax=Thalassotalea sp. 1_MG-2023 TaxID=3062680 RepID=UPI0026E2300F|nr:GreA/GreB family elongation factor [Thalassotalea sp. 1_MG-2023]MDO6426370.1 GreA/GreB family elongation factor [Thalassotalea sp. 1_MG-2023]